MTGPALDYQVILRLLLRSMGAHGPFRFIPPIRLGNGLIGGGIASDRTHHSQIIFLDNLLHELDSLEIT